MCYHCATNPSIHHHHHHVAAVSSLLSHHGVAFTSVVVSSLPSWCHLCCRIVAMLSSPSCRCHAFAVTLLQFHCPCHSVAFIVALSRFRCCCCGVAFAFVMVSLLPSWCCLRIGRGFVVAIAVLPSHWSQFCRCHRSVAFVVASSRCHRHSHIVVVPSLLHCRSFVIAVTVSPSSLHCRHFVVAVMVSPSCLLRFHRRRRGVTFMSVTVSSLPLQCHLHVGCSFVIAIAVSPSHQSQFCQCCRGVAFSSVAVSSLPSQCRLHCHIVAVSSSQSHHCGAFTVALLQLAFEI